MPVHINEFRLQFRLLSVLAPLAIAGSSMANASLGPSLQPDVPFQEHLHDEYLVRDGLPSSWINDIVQTRDGLVWIATDNGLVRFDGLAFRHFDRVSTPALPSNEVRVLLEGSDGGLWIGTESGLIRYQSGRPPRFEAVPSIPGHAVRAIFEERSGKLWVGTMHETFVGTPDRGFEPLPDAPTDVRAVCEDDEGTMWFGSNDGLFRQLGDSYEQIVHEFLPAETPANAGIPFTRVNSLLVDEDGSLWIGGNRALLRWKDGEFTRDGRDLGRQQVYDVLQTRNGHVYAAARFGLYGAIDEGRFQRVSSNPSAFCLLEDRTCGLWVGYGDNRGLHTYRSNPSRVVWNESTVRCIHVDDDGSLWIGSDEGMHHLRGDTVDDYGINDGLPDPRVQTIIPGADKVLWIGTVNGLAKWTDRAGRLEPGPGQTGGLNIGAGLEDSNGNLWVSLASSGGYVLNGDALTELVPLREGRIHWFHEDSRGRIWIGHESGLYRHHDAELKRITDAALERLNAPRFLCHFVDRDGTLWMGTSNGIARYRDGRFDAVTPQDGLRAEKIERLAADTNGNLWFGGRKGLFRTTIQEFGAVAHGDISRIASYRVGDFERFPPLRAFSQGCAVADTLLIVGEFGVSRISPEFSQMAVDSPHIDIEQVIVDGVGAGFQDGFDYRSGPHRLAMRFVVSSVENPQEIQVRYRVDGYDEGWIHAGADRIAYYTDLGPGAYRFRVAARRGNDEWTEADPVRFSVLPRWWETRWFQVAAAAGFLGLTVMGVQYRTRSVRRTNAILRREIQERERAEEDSRQRRDELARVSRAATMGELTTSIAHEVKQPLFAIVSNAQTARRLLDADPPDVDEVREALGDIASDGDRASSIIDHVRSLVRKERPPTERLDMNDVTQSVVRLVDPEIRKRGLKINLALAPDLPPVEGNAVELQQVILNLLINAAQAMSNDRTTIELNLRTSASNDTVELAVEDQGVGVADEDIDRLFEPFFTTRPEGTGMGLAINRTIIEAHGGRIWATRNPERGMTFHFSLPACRVNAS